MTGCIPILQTLSKTAVEKTALLNIAVGRFMAAAERGACNGYRRLFGKAKLHSNGYGGATCIREQCLQKDQIRFRRRVWA